MIEKILCFLVCVYMFYFFKESYDFLMFCLENVWRKFFKIFLLIMFYEVLYSKFCFLSCWFVGLYVFYGGKVVKCVVICLVIEI